MADATTVPAEHLDRLVYLAVAAANDDAETDILAGVALQLALARPDASAAEFGGAFAELRDAIIAGRLAHQADLAADSAALMLRLLVRVVPGLTSPALRSAARGYVRAFLNSHRRGTSSLRQVAPIDLQFDRYGEVDRFRRETWERLYDQARARPAVAAAIDGGPIAKALGVLTTQDAATVLRLVELEPLSTFVASRAQPGGGILVTRADIDATLAGVGSTVTNLTSAYAANLVAVNAAQQKVEAKVEAKAADKAKDKQLSEFEQLVKNAEEKQKELDEILEKSAKGVKGTFGVLSFAAENLGASDLASDIDEYKSIVTKLLDAARGYSADAVAVAKVVAGLDELTMEKVLFYGGIGFNVAILAAMIQVTGLLGKPKPSANQVILQQLREIRKQIVDLRDEMRVRFDRLEKRLNKVYVGILDRLEEIDFDIGQIEGDVNELQQALYDLHGEVQRLYRDIHGFLEAAHRRELVETINGFLRFRERTGEELSLQDFRRAENEFFTWGNDHAKDTLQAGPDTRNFADEDLLGKL